MSARAQIEGVHQPGALPMLASIKRLFAALAANLDSASRAYVRQAFDKPWLRERQA